MPSDDLVAKPISVVWDNGKYQETLNMLRDQASERAGKTADWYYKHRIWLCRWGRFLRLSAIILTAFSGLLPIFNEIYQSSELQQALSVLSQKVQEGSSGNLNGNGIPVRPMVHSDGQSPFVVPGYLLNPTWSAVALALAVTFAMIDRFYGASTGWVRYIVTAQRITAAMESFHLKYESQRLNWTVPEPSREQAHSSLMLINGFVQEIHSIVREETSIWVAEFSSVVKQLEEQIATASKSQHESAVQIHVQNGNQCESGWKIEVDSTPFDLKRGNNASVVLSPGFHVIHVSGSIGGVEVNDEKSVISKTGEIISIEFLLS